MAKIKAAALQLPTLGMSLNRLEYFIKAAQNEGVNLLLLGEYVLNHFFLELRNLPKSMVKEQSQKHLSTLENISQKYDMAICAPIVVIQEEKYYKCMAFIEGSNTQLFEQEFLINYDHWDEKGFFSNSGKAKQPVIDFHGVKIAPMFGFELHCNTKFDTVMDQEVDLVLLSTCSTFDSHNRWREVIKSRAFMHNCYILRANRIGEYTHQKHKWRFYGDSMLALPNGEVGDMLDDKESLLIATIDSRYAQQEREAWGFFQR